MWTLGTVSGPQTVSVSLRSAIGSPLTFTATVNSGPAKRLVRVSGDGQIAAINTDFAQQLTIGLADTFGNAKVGASVTWSVVSGSATFSEPGSITDASGVAAQTATAGASPGPVLIRATTAALPAAAVDFNLTVQ